MDISKISDTISMILDGNVGLTSGVMMALLIVFAMFISVALGIIAIQWHVSAEDTSDDTFAQVCMVFFGVFAIIAVVLSVIFCRGLIMFGSRF